jgi:hypothetical protein
MHCRDYNICVPSESLANFLTTTRSIRKMSVHVRIRRLERDPPNAREMLMAAFGRAQSLQDLELSVRSVDAGIILSERIASSMNLRVIRLNNGGTRRATLSQCQGLARFLSSTRTLCHVFLRNYSFGSESVKVLLTALQCNQTVTCLSFWTCKIMAKETADLFDRSRHTCS